MPPFRKGGLGGFLSRARLWSCHRVNSKSQGEPVEGTPEDARKEGHIIRARFAPLSPVSGFPVSRSE